MSPDGAVDARHTRERHVCGRSRRFAFVSAPFYGGRPREDHGHHVSRVLCALLSGVRPGSRFGRRHRHRCHETPTFFFVFFF